MKRSTAEILREYGPFPGVDRVNGVTYDGEHVWFAVGGQAERPRSGQRDNGALDRCRRSCRERPSTAGTSFRSPKTASRKSIRRPAECIATIPAPGGGGDSGLAWAEGTLWVGQHRGRKIHQVDPQTGAILRTIESNRFVTGVTWVERRAVARHLGRG